MTHAPASRSLSRQSRPRGQRFLGALGGSWADAPTTDSAQRYPGYVIRGEARVLRDKIFNSSGSAATWIVVIWS
eukprot:3831986-Prymnesium_polylepis.1